MPGQLESTVPDHHLPNASTGWRPRCVAGRVAHAVLWHVYAHCLIPLARSEIQTVRSFQANVPKLGQFPIEVECYSVQHIHAPENRLQLKVHDAQSKAVANHCTFA